MHNSIAAGGLKSHRALMTKKYEISVGFSGSSWMLKPLQLPMTPRHTPAQSSANSIERRHKFHTVGFETYRNGCRSVSATHDGKLLDSLPKALPMRTSDLRAAGAAVTCWGNVQERRFPCSKSVGPPAEAFAQRPIVCGHDFSSLSCWPGVSRFVKRPASKQVRCKGP